MLKLSLKIIVFYIFLHIFTKVYALDFTGKFVQGHFIIGKTNKSKYG